MNISHLTPEHRAEALHHLRCAARARAIQWDHEREIERIMNREINADISTLAAALDCDAEDLDPDSLTCITKQDLEDYCSHD